MGGEGAQIVAELNYQLNYQKEKELKKVMNHPLTILRKPGMP